MKSSGCQDVDYLSPLEKQPECLRKGIDLREMPEEELMTPGYFYRGSSVFGATGGVMEAALRSVYEIVSGKTLESLDFYDVREWKE